MENLTLSIYVFFSRYVFFMSACYSTVNVLFLASRFNCQLVLRNELPRFYSLTDG
jgi:hypothetical protein